MPKKDPYEDLDQDFKDAVAAMDEGQIRATIAKTALNQTALIEAKELDADLAEKKESYSEAGAVYREGTKANKLRIGFCRRVLGDKGKDNGSFQTE